MFNNRYARRYGGFSHVYLYARGRRTICGRHGEMPCEATSTEDRGLFMRWLFAAMALHPEVASMAAVSPQQRDDLNKRTGALIQKLLTETCRTEARQALRYEGPATIQYAFQIFGQAAAGDLFSDPRVAAGMKDLAKYIDQEKMKQLATPDDPK
jgi:hypothetical protein